jgi:hypothetical protein
VIVAAGKKDRSGPIGILIVILLPDEAERIKRGGALSRDFSDIDSTLGEGTLLVGGSMSEEEAIAQLAKRFPEVAVRKATK